MMCKRDSPQGQADEGTDGQTDRQTGRQADKQAGRETDSRENSHAMSVDAKLSAWLRAKP